MKHFWHVDEKERINKTEVPNRLAVSTQYDPAVREGAEEIFIKSDSSPLTGSQVGDERGTFIR